MSAKLAIIGASYLQLPLVKRAMDMGIETICFAWEDGAVCKDVCTRFYPISIMEKEQILSVCRQEKIDGITTIATDVAVPTIAYVAQTLKLVGNSVECAYKATNKYAMRQALRAGGVKCPFFALVHNSDEASAALAKTSLPVILKPCDRSGSMGVTKVETTGQLSAAVDAAVNASFVKAAILEKFVDIAQEISVEGISWQGEHYVLAVTDKVTTGAPHYVEIGQHQPSHLPTETLAEAVRQVKLGVKALGIEYGASHPELMVAKDGQVYVTEIGARMGGDFIGSDLVYLSTGYDFLKGVIEVALGQFTPPAKKWSRAAGVWFYSPDTPMVKDFIDHRSEHPEILRWELHEDILRPLTRSADRAGYFIYQGNARLNLA